MIWRDEFKPEAFIWRPIMAKLVTLEAVNKGEVSVRQLLVLNQLMDADEYQREQQRKEAER